MSCPSPTALVNNAACYQCLLPINDAVLIYLLCQWAQTGGEVQGEVLGDPDGAFMFGDPGLDIIFGIP